MNQPADRGSGTLRVLLLRDRKPGHFHQVEGLGRIIAGMAPATLDRFDVRPAWYAHSKTRQWLLRRRGDPARLARFLYGPAILDLAAADVIVGSGRPTIAAGILLAERFRGKFVYSGWPSGFDRSRIHLILANSPRLMGEPNTVWTPVPSLVDRCNLPAPRPLRRVEDLAGADMALMIGGDSHGHSFSHGEWRSLASFLEASAAALKVRWRVSTSRRSPDFLRPLLADLAARGVIEEFLDYRTAGPGSGNRLFAADAVVVTEDSLSMLSEGLAAGRPVVALKPAKVEDSSANEVVAGHAGQGWLAVLPLRSMTPERFASHLLALRVPERPVREVFEAALAPLLTGPGDRR